MSSQVLLFSHHDRWPVHVSCPLAAEEFAVGAQHLRLLNMIRTFVEQLRPSAAISEYLQCNKHAEAQENKKFRFGLSIALTNLFLTICIDLSCSKDSE
jgi:sulfur relay (sulfurtransferase) DsrC/TusE family protein